MITNLTLVYTQQKVSTFTQIFKRFNRLYKRITTHNYGIFPNIFPENTPEKKYQRLFSKDLKSIDQDLCNKEKSLKEFSTGKDLKVYC